MPDMRATVAAEHQLAEPQSAAFPIASWPKVTMQFAGLSVFNTDTAYVCMLSRLHYWT